MRLSLIKAKKVKKSLDKRPILCYITSMKFKKGDKVAHKLNPLYWKGEVTEVKLNGRMKVMLVSGIEVEVGPFVPLKLDR